MYKGGALRAAVRVFEYPYAALSGKSYAPVNAVNHIALKLRGNSFRVQS